MKEEKLPFYEITDFLYHLKGDKRLSDNTISAYKKDIIDYGNFLVTYQNVYDVSDIDKEMIDKYIKSLKRRELKKSSITRKITVIKAFHHFLKEDKIVNDDPSIKVESVKLEKHLPEVLSVEEITKMIEAVDTTTLVGIRNKAILEVLYASGLRISELLDLRTNDIHLKEKYIEVIGKGNKERIVPLGEMAVIALRKYIEDARSLLSNKPSNILFYNYQGNKLSRQYVFKYIRELAKKCGITKTISPHTIRHSFATHLLEGGTDLRIVQELLGHEDIETTEIYTHINKSHLKDLINNIHPLAKKHTGNMSISENKEKLGN